MSLLTGLPAVFGAALAPLAADGVLHSTTLTDTGAGGFSASTVDMPVKLLVESLSAADRVGLPRDAIHFTVLSAGQAVTVALDDSVTVGSATYRIISVDTNVPGASVALVGVPA